MRQKKRILLQTELDFTSGEKMNLSASILSTNPWSDGKESQRLPVSMKEISVEKILSDITDSLLKWPGQETVNLKPLDRHNRLVQVIAGYPHIDMDRLPFDWPTHPRAAISLKLSRALDSLVCPINGKSLRSTILDIDLGLRYRLKDDDNEELIKEYHKESLILLLMTLRASDNGPGMSMEFFTEKEIDFLTALHSNENTSMQKWWPFEILKERLSVWQLPSDIDKQDYEFGEEIGKLYHKMKNPNGLTKDEQKKLAELEKKKATKVDIRECEDKRKKLGELFNHHENKEIIRFEFRKIQSWINFWLRATKKMKGTGQRLQRGCSFFLEAAISVLRKYVISNFGAGSILVDGGGRIEFVVTLKDESVENITNEIVSIVENFMIRNQTGVGASLIQTESETILNIELKEEIAKRAGIDENGKEWFPRLMLEDWKEHLGEEYTKKVLPPYFCYSVNDRQEDLDEKTQEILYKIKAWKDNENQYCLFCNPDSEKWTEKDRDRVDPLMKDKSKACRFHRLIYEIGHQQRKRESTIGKTDPNYIPQLVKRGRKVISIAYIDANLLGLIFPDNISTDHSEWLDRRRRRSFRFNAGWWISIQESLRIPKFAGDRFALWLAAGDDIVIAEYLTNDDSTNISDSIMPEFIQYIDDKLYKHFQEMIERKISFCGGISTRKKNIHETRIASQDNEKKAKRIFKTLLKQKHPEQLRRQDGTYVEFQPLLESKLNPGMKLIRLNNSDGIIIQS
jgi:hypothetical protein